MTKGRAWALPVALAGLACLASIPLKILDHHRDRSRQPSAAVANGIEVDVEPSGQDFLATVEYRIGPTSAPIRYQSATPAIGYVLRRPTLQQGDRVVVEFDPRKPHEARVFSIAPLWWSVVRRAIAGGLLLVGAIAILISWGPPRGGTKDPTVPRTEAQG